MPWLFVLPLLAVIGVFVVLPLLSTLRLSIFTESIFTGVESFVGPGNYVGVFGSDAFWPTLATTAIWTAGSLAGQLGLGLAAALVINRGTRLVKGLRSLLVLPYIVPAIALALIWRWMLDSDFGVVTHVLNALGLVPDGQTPLGEPSSAMVSVIIANVWHGFPFAMLIYWAALQTIDSSQYEAARVDGANALQQFRFVTLPGLRNATIALLVLRGIWTLTYFDLIYLITGGGPAGATTTWPIWIYHEAIGRSRFGFASAIAIVLAFAMFALVLWYVRRMRTPER
ncbi:MAG: sugar ABC transporter permease [Microbacteriaceae bacterium]|nr:sugar ABC transporter permease [Microbacteriaceae bacterium]